MNVDLVFKIIQLVGSIVVIFILIVGVEIMIARSGPREDFINPSREYVYFGKKPAVINYLVMGESTAAGQGGTYEKGIAYSTAKHLAKKETVRMINTSISGATLEKLIKHQLDVGVNSDPDVVLIAVGGNDVNSVTNLNRVETNLEYVINTLINKNCNVKIILTGAPDMGSLPRFMQPLRALAGWQTKRLNTVFEKVITKYNLTLAPIAKETGPVFSEDPTLFAADRFHPNDIGYELWNNVINPTLDQAFLSQPSHCKKD
ncbi:MAG: SGNH/GDSL hydrolase family protein [Weeksellaceae bacterium]